MNRIITELRRREVFRTAGLYVGVCWILIEAASVFLPTFDAPDWILRAIIIATVVGFPIMLVLAWVYDVNESGIEVQSDDADAVVPPLLNRQMDFIVIGLLSVALIFSVYMNVTSVPGDVVKLDPMSVLIADFDNQTGDPLFEGSLEQALSIGIEGASFITAFGRAAAKELVENIAPGTALDSAGARLVAIREGVRIIIAGTVTEKGGAYTLSAEAIRPEDGESVSSVSVTAKNKLEVLTAVSKLAEDLREDLGDTTISGEGSVVGETFTATSLEALLHYAVAQELSISGKYEESLAAYELAVKADPDFGRALSGWALSLFYLGRQEEATVLWERALSKMNSMTERERLRTLGLYYVAVTGNYEKAIENYSALVKQFPADSAGYNNLAVAYFSTLDFDNARIAGGKALEIYPANKVMLSNFALYAMYSGDFETASTRAKELLEMDSTMYMAWLPLAMSAFASGDVAAAKEAYDQMAAAGGRGVPLAELGRTDLAMFSGDFTSAISLAQAEIAKGAESTGQRSIAVYHLIIASAMVNRGELQTAKDSLAAALAATQSASLQFAAALVYVDAGDSEAASAIQLTLAERLQPQSRAFGKIVEGRIAMGGGKDVAAIDALRTATGFADLWLGRYFLGQAYLQAGYFAEAMDEFALCRQRQGEATAVFLDDMPSWRYTSMLDYWLGRSQEGLGMTDAARASYQKFMGGYQADDAISQDAKSRVP